MVKRHLTTTVAASALALATPLLLVACTSKAGGDGAIKVTSSDAACDLDSTSAETGDVDFTVTNNGSKVTEFYVYGPGDKVMGEIENVSPGLQRKLIVQLPEAGTYKTACKPGMVGDGIRSDLTVTGEAAQLSEDETLAQLRDSFADLPGGTPLTSVDGMIVQSATAGGGEVALSSSSPSST